MSKVLYLAIIFLCFLNIKSYGQETAKVPTNTNDSFIVIISVLEPNSNQTIADIQSYLQQSNSGLRYMGFCTNQNCFVLNASANKYGLALDVLKNLETEFPNASINYKNVLIQDFYKTCIFSTQQEHYYFKYTYRR